MRLIRWIVLAALCPFVAFAYEPEEHQKRSDEALKTVVKHYAGSDAMRAAAAKIGSTFGEVTSGVDWFTDPSKYLLDPAQYATELAARGAKNPIAFLKRGVAMHNNGPHFQNEALDHWRRYHQDALTLAAHPAKAEEALLAEAVALHYLHDFFSAGHLVTPRGGMHDAAAGQMHDYFIQRGVDLELKKSWEISTAIGHLEADGALSSEAGSYRDEVGHITRWHGDRWLDRRPAQKAFIAAITTLSIAEVFEASVASAGKRRRGLQTCFTDRSPITPDPKKPWLEVAGPDGGIRVVDVEVGQVPAVVSCADGDDWFARYQALEDPELMKKHFELSGFDVRGEIAVGNESRDVRVNVDLLFFVMADDPKGGAESKWMKLKMGTVGPTFAYTSRYEAWGLMYDYTLPVGASRAFSWGYRLAPRRYDYSAAQPWRLDAALKGSIGIDVVNIVVAVERGHGVMPDGRFRREYFFSVGGDIAIAQGWTIRAREGIARGWRRVRPGS